MSCTKPQYNLTNPELWCNEMMNATFISVHVALPMGWFFLCRGITYSCFPTNTISGPCTLRGVTVSISPYDHSYIYRGWWFKWVTLQFDANFDSNVNLLSKGKAVALALSSVNIPGLTFHNHRQLTVVTCILTKTINFTSQALAASNKELGEVWHAI